MNDSVYQVIELIGSSSDSWELAAQNAVRRRRQVVQGPARRRGRGDGRADRERRDHRLPHEAAPQLQAIELVCVPDNVIPWGASGDDVADLEVDDLFHVEADRLEDRVAVLVELGRPAWRGRPRRRTASARRRAGTACRRRSRSPGCSRWRSPAGRPRPRACPAPRPTGPRTTRAARATRRASRRRTPRSRIATASPLFAISDVTSAKRSSSFSSGRPMMSHSRRPVLARLETGEGERAAVARAVVAASAGSWRHGRPAAPSTGCRARATAPSPRPSTTCRWRAARRRRRSPRRCARGGTARP